MVLMCFSAVASFAGGAALTLIGVATIRKNKEPARLLFAAIPLVFGVQQIAEGFVWLALQSAWPDVFLKVAVYMFLTAAVVVWPTVVPLSILLAEQSPSKVRRWALRALLAAGLAVSASYGLGMLTWPVKAVIQQAHVLYTIDSMPSYAGVAALAYLAATVPPLFVTSDRKIRWFGWIIALAYAVTYFAFSAYLVSVWCFFAAIASAVIWWIVGTCAVVCEPRPEAA
jgi:hypothetical protein